MPREAGPGGESVRALITSVVRRRLARHVAWAVTCMVVVTVVALAAARAGGWASEWAMVVAGLVGGSLVLWRTSPLRSRRAAAAAIESVRPHCRNVIITAEELERHPQLATGATADRVFAEAERLVTNIRAGDVVPLRRAAVALGIAGVLAVLLIPDARLAMRDVTPARAEQERAPLVSGSVRFSIDPPAYADGPSVILTDPERIEVLERSRVRVEASGTTRVRFGSGAVAEIVAHESGYFAVEGADGTSGRLIPLTVTPDHAPVVRVEAPGKDLLLPDGSRTIPVAISASDDLALSSLELRFTRVSGSGEQFEFEEGSLPVRLARSSSRDWRAEGALMLPAMNLGPGDSLVYRAVARDRRPDDAGLASSDTFMLEIAGPGQVALEGVEMPSELERYAMSQQMIVLKLERLRARETSLPRHALVEETAAIAAEQRTVRANFIFLLGGHVEDEFEEAEHSHEIQEGRLENTARKDINDAIAEMTRVGEGLAALDVPAALPPARAAVESLQRAFGRSRYLLRSLAVRSRLDPGRRLTGDLQDAGDWQRTSPDAEDRDGEAVRRLLGDAVEAVSVSRQAGGLPLPRRQALAEAALAIDPASELWQDMARRLAETSDEAGLQAIIGDLSARALEGIARPTTMERSRSALIRAYRKERKQ